MHDKPQDKPQPEKKQSSQSAVYLVTQEPGVQIPGVGFFGPGQRFSMPEDYVPSTAAVVPCNGTAAAALKKAKEERVRLREEALANLEPPRKLSKGERESILRMPETVEADEPSPQEQQAMSDSLSPRQLSEGRLTGPGVGPDNRPLVQPKDEAKDDGKGALHKGTRAADR